MLNFLTTLFCIALGLLIYLKLVYDDMKRQEKLHEDEKLRARIWYEVNRSERVSDRRNRWK